MTTPQYTLFYFTESYPYGLGESFVEPELAFLAQHFKVLLFPLNGSGKARALPEGVELQPVVPAGSTKLRQLKNWRRYNQILTEERQAVSNPAFFDAHKAEYRSMLAQASLRADRIQAEAAKHELVIYYSFWMNNWALALRELLDREEVGRYVVRVNGFDLYDDRREGNYVPFRNRNVDGAARVLTTSAFAEKYLHQCYPDHQTAFETNYLGTVDHGEGRTKAPDHEPALKILSVGWLRPVKRVDILARAIAELETPVHWTHVGDGPQLKAIKEITDQYGPQHQVDFKGNISHQELMNLYQAEYFHALVHTSESEGGAPVALQEAMSFGVPLVGMAVGGVPEVINDTTGQLLSPDATPVALSKILAGLRDSKWQQEDTRATIRKYWADHFTAEKHQQRLLEILMETT